MRPAHLALAALSLVALCRPSASGETRLVPPARLTPIGVASAQPPKDSPEPPVSVTATFTSGTGTLTAASGASGATLRLTPTYAHGNAARLTFKAAPPLRLALRLGGLANTDIGDLSLAFGTTKLRAGAVGTGKSTSHFDRQGKPVRHASLAAYTVQVQRLNNGEVDVRLERARGVTPGKELSVSWGPQAYSSRPPIPGSVSPAP